MNSKLEKEDLVLFKTHEHPVRSPQLKRVLGLPALTFITIGFIIGGGVFVFTGIVFRITGPALPIAYALAGITVFMSILPMAMLGSAIPCNGANYKYPSRLFSPVIAFVGSWTFTLCAFFGLIPLLVNGCVTYIQSFFPDIPSLSAALILLTFFYLVNLLGVKIAAIIQGILLLVQLSALLLYSATGLIELDLMHFDDIWQQGAGNILLGASLLTFTYTGANAIIELGGDIIHPRQSIPRAFFISFPIVALVYILVAIATAGMVTVEMPNESKETLIQVSSMMFKEPGRIFFVFGGAVVALVTTLNALFITGSKSFLVIVQDNLLPQSLGKLSPKLNTPYRVLTLFWIISVLGTVLRLSPETLTAYSSLGALTIMIPIQLVALTFYKKHPDLYTAAAFKLKGVWQFICPLTGILTALFFGVVILVDLGSLYKISGFFLFMLSGTIYFYWRKHYLLKNGIDLNRLKNKNDWS